VYNYFTKENLKNIMFPILKINGGAVESFWVLYVLSFIIGGIIFFSQAKKNNLSLKKAICLIILIAVASLAGSRLGYVLLNLKEFIANPLKIIFFWKGGLTSFGGIILAIGVSYVFLKKQKEPLGKWFDLGMISFLVGHSIGRIGCFLEGCCYGLPSQAPWAIKFPSLNDGIPRHPTQLYESFGYLISFLIVLIINKKIKIKNGSIFFIGLALHETVRFIVEYFRSNDIFLFHGNNWYNTLTAAQSLNLLFIVFSLLAFVFLNQNNKNWSSPNR
jgi:phosphatidylglycerol:prolipoprotein diacylglycerol transferase